MATQEELANQALAISKLVINNNLVRGTGYDWSNSLYNAVYFAAIKKGFPEADARKIAHVAFILGEESQLTNAQK